jgi:hypothetical protein
MTKKILVMIRFHVFVPKVVCQVAMTLLLKKSVDDSVGSGDDHQGKEYAQQQPRQNPRPVLTTGKWLWLFSLFNVRCLHLDNDQIGARWNQIGQQDTETGPQQIPNDVNG